MEITTDSGKTWEDLGPYIVPGSLGYNETIIGNSELQGRRAFSGFAFGVTVIDLSPFAGKMARIRFRYATSSNSFSVPDGGTGWIIADILLSATANITNTAILFDSKKAVSGFSTVITKIKGKNIPAGDFVVEKQHTKALLTWHTPEELNEGIYQIEKSINNGASFKPIGRLNTIKGHKDLHFYNFTDKSPSAGLNLYRLKNITSKGVNYSVVKKLSFENLKVVNIFPNPAKDRVKIFIPGNNQTAILQLMDATGKQINNYRMPGQNMELNLPQLSSGVYYLNVIRNGIVSKHKIVIE